MTNAAQLAVGATAPNFSLPSTFGEVDLSWLRTQSQRGVILYFYPRASTPGCTTQAMDFRDALTSLSSSGYVVLGISPDPLSVLETFRDEQDLTFALASDEDHAVAEAYGAWGEKSNYGRTVEGLIRSTVVVAPSGEVALAKYNVKATGHVERLARELGVEL